MRIRVLLWKFLVRVYPFILRRIYKMDIGQGVVISYKAKLDRSINPRGIHIGKNTWILANATILAHDHCRGLKVDTYIGGNCVIGINAIIMPGVVIGDQCVIGSGAVVTRNIPSHCVAVGNPAKIIKEEIQVNDRGQII